MELILHPAPNWYSSSAISADARGQTIALATRNTVTFFSNEKPIGEFSLQGGERITCVKFHTATSLQHILATGGSEGSLKIWDTDTRREIRATTRQKGCSVTAMEFPPSLPHLLVYSTKRMNKTGNLVILELQNYRPTCTALNVVPPREIVLCLASPKTRFPLADRYTHVIAAGCSGGTLLLVDVCEGKLLCSIRNELATPIHAVDWSGDGDWLLLTAQQNKITIWRYEPEKNEMVRIQVLTDDEGSKAKSKGSPWQAAMWTSNRNIVCSWRTNHVALWSFPEALVGPSNDNITQPTVISKTSHDAQVFNLLSVATSNGRVIYSVSMDRKIGIWSPEELEMLSWIDSSAPGFPLAMTIYSPQRRRNHSSSHSVPDNGILVSLGDGSVRLITLRSNDIPTVSENIITAKNSFSLSGKLITCLQFQASHVPAKPGLLVVGTKAGSVHLFQCSPGLSKEERGRLNHGCSVSQVLFFCKSVLSVGIDGRVIQWDLSPGNEEDYSQVNAPEGKWFDLPRVDSLSVQETQSIMAFVSNGKVYVRSSDRVVFEQTLGASSVALHGDYKREKILLAVGTKTGEVHIWERKLVTGSRWTSRPCLGKHGRNVIALVFCQTSAQNMLLSRAEGDQTLQVWKEEEANWAQNVNLRGHTGRILVADWCGQEGDEVITGSDDHTMRLWTLSRHSHVSPPGRARTS